MEDSIEEIVKDAYALSARAKKLPANQVAIASLVYSPDQRIFISSTNNKFAIAAILVAVAEVKREEISEIHRLTLFDIATQISGFNGQVTE